MRKLLTFILLLCSLCWLDFALAYGSAQGNQTAFRILSGTSLPTTNNIGDVFCRTTDATFWGGTAVNVWGQLALAGAGAAFTNPKITGGLLDANGNTMLAFTPTASAVDFLTISNSAAGNPGNIPLSATGPDTNISIQLVPKGNGTVTVSTSGPTALEPPSIGGLAFAVVNGNNNANIDVYSNGDLGNSFFFLEANGTLSTPTVSTNGDTAGRIIWDGNDGTNFLSIAQISAFVSSIPALNNIQGTLKFVTSAGGSSATAMLINGSQFVGVGATTPVDPLSISTAINASATHALFNLSNTVLSSGSGGGTYIGANPVSFAGDFEDFQVNNVKEFALSNAGKVTQYNAVATAGQGVPAIPGLTSQKNETTTPDANVLTVTPPAAVGTYRVSVAISVSAATTGVISWTLSYKDSNANAQTNIAEQIFQAGTAAPNTTFTTSAAGNYYGSVVIDVDASATAIVVKWVGGGTTTAKMSAAIERLN